MGYWYEWQGFGLEIGRGVKSVFLQGEEAIELYDTLEDSDEKTQELILSGYDCVME